jgi:hypothetical protein
MKTKFVTHLEQLTAGVHCEDCIDFINAALLHIDSHHDKETQRQGPQNLQNNIFSYPSPGSLIRPNVIANNSSRARFETAVLNVPEEFGMLLRFEILELEFSTDLEYNSFTTLSEEIFTA